MKPTASGAEPLAAETAGVADVRACRNCGGVIAASDGYCRHCGQETHVALPTVRHFLRDAAGRYIALDGRLWRTLGVLMARPGMLTREYIRGRRRRYIRPGRLFLVTSIALFAVIRLVANPGPVLVFDSPQDKRAAPSSSEARRGANVPSREHARAGSATAKEARAGVGGEVLRDAGDHAGNEVLITLGDALNVTLDRDLDLRISGNAPGVPLLRERIEHFNRLPRAQKSEQLLANVLRFGPYAAVALLPAFALLLKLVYPLASRRNPDRPRRFAAHLVFAAHNHAFLFLTLIVMLFMPKPMQDAIIIYSTVYLLYALRNVYGGGWTSTFMRSLLLLAPYSVLFIVVTLILLAAALILQ